MAAKLKPIKDRLVIELIEETENKTAGGIIIPDTSVKEKLNMGKVIEVGSDEELKKEIKKGDTVMFQKYAGNDVKLGEKKYMILKFDDILAVVK
ncbi:MAG: co-chaperone GroES [Candidatus Delongbacteria bacterium]|nr:co-chaperone GroES [Candidatus Delongbacteria bacterium]